jgi:hypothetical protein
VVAIHRHLVADERDGPEGIGGGLQADQFLQALVGRDLLLHLAESDQLLGELGGIHGVQRILVLQLLGQQQQEVVVGFVQSGSRVVRARARTRT